MMVELIDPQSGELCNDPACGIFGFMIAEDKHIKKADTLSNAGKALKRYDVVLTNPDVGTK